MSLKILVADDDSDNRTIAKEILEISGFVVVEAKDGLEALELVAKENPDALLLDLSMPKMNGWDVAKKIKEEAAHPKMPIIAFTAHAIVGDEVKAKAAGCDDYLSKPCVPIELVKKIKKWLPGNPNG
jgi:two-component system cell cycle response regulator DivK